MVSISTLFIAKPVVRTALMISAFMVVDCSAEDWPQFLGPDRNGMSAETGLISSWPEAGLKPAWRAPLGEGMSGIAVSGQRLFTMYQDDTNQYVVCCNVENGKTLWETAIAPRYQNSMGHGPRATPTIIDGQVIVFSGEGVLASLKSLDGKINWKVNTIIRTQAKPAEYGMSGSPLVVGDQVIVQTNSGAQGFTVGSYSLTSGKLNWGANNQPAGYSSPALLKCGTAKYITVFCGKSLFGVDPSSGKIAWKYPFATEYNCNTASPINIGGRVFISSGENHGSALLEFSKVANQELQVKESWTSLGRESVLRSEWQTPVQHGGYLYGFDNVGSASAITHLTCVGQETGKVVWRKTRFGKGNLIFADGMLIVSTMKGELVLVKAISDHFELIGRQKLLGQTRQAPALSNGRVYLRDNSELVCVDLRR